MGGCRRHRCLRALLVAAILIGVPPIARAGIDLWPLLEVSENSTTVLYPLFVRDESFLMVFPLYYRTNSGEDHHLLWPFLKLSKGRLARLAPIWFGEPDADRAALLPLYFRRGDFEFMLPSLYRSRHEGAVVRWGVWPFLGYENDEGQRKISSLLLWNGEWGEKETRLSFWPLFSRRRRPEGLSMWIAPFYMKSTETERELTLFPVFSSWRQGERRGLWLAPFLYASGPEEWRAWLFGLFDLRRRPVRIVTGPTPEGEDSPPERTEIHRSVRLLGWRFLSAYTRSSVHSAEGVLLARSRRLLIFSHGRNRSGERVFKLLGLPLVKRQPARVPPTAADPAESPASDQGP